METLFSGFLLFGYVLSYYAGKYLFAVAVAFPLLFSFFAVVLPLMGRKGKMCRAAREAKRMAKAGAIVPENADIFYRQCVKCGGVRFCLAYRSYVEGNASFSEFAGSVKGLFEEGRHAAIAVLDCASLFLGLLVFLCYYWVCPLSETLLRVCAVGVCAVASRLTSVIASYAYSARARKAAFTVCEVAEKYLLPRCAARRAVPSPHRQSCATPKPMGGEEGLETLRRMLQSLDKDR